MSFGDLEITYDDRVLTPRAWTVMQAEWAAELLGSWPAGPVLELGCGAGQIGLLALHRLGNPARRLVCVDESPAACELAQRNAESAGLAERVDVRQQDLGEAAASDERYALVIADPPWVPTSQTDQYPEDPPDAIDGGADGLDDARVFVRVAAGHLLPGGSVLLQLGTHEQAEKLDAELAGLEVTEVREGDGGVVARLQWSRQGEDRD
jgi:HemK-like putative methylase